MRVLFALTALASLTACAAPDLSGDWTGSTTCDGFPIDLTFDLAATEDEGEYQGSGVASADDGQGNAFEMSFAIEVEHGDKVDVGLDLEVDVEECTDPDGNQWTCPSAAWTWDEGDDEIAGTFTGFPVNSGDCDVEVER